MLGTNYIPAELNNKVKGQKANFRRACRKFDIINGQFVYNCNRIVINSRDQQLQIIRDVHVGLGGDTKAKAMASHRGRDTTYQKIVERFHCQTIVADIIDCIKKCDQCQKQRKICKVISPELQSISVPNSVMQQVGVDICNLPEVDRFKHLIV